MHVRPWILGVGVALAAGLSARSGRPDVGGDETGATPAPVDFDRQVRPLLSDRCFRCHGPDAAARRADLRLDSFAGATAARRGGPALVPGDAGASELVARIRSTDPDERMPPPESNLTLTDAEAALLERWVAEGASYAEPWFVRAPRRHPAPAVRDASWPRDELDRFVLSALEAEGRTPRPASSPRAWLRRVSFDLTGLPPTPEEVAAFLAEDAATRRASAVERLLASPRFGERMASDWLDVARYADTYGYQNDVERRGLAVARLGRATPSTRTCPGTTSSPGSSPGDMLPEPDAGPAAWRRPSTDFTARPTRAAASTRSCASSTSPTACTPSARPSSA